MKTKILIYIISAILSQQIFNNAYAQFASENEIIHTAKIIFSKNQSGALRAEIIPYTSNGSYPKSGWITCEVIALDISKTYSEKLKNKGKIEGYFIATYKKIKEDKNSSILKYKGVLIKIETWNPPFIKNPE